MAIRFADIQTTHIWIVRAEANRLVKIFQALFELPEVQVVIAQPNKGDHHGGVKGKRAFVLRDRFVEPPFLKTEYASL